MYFEKKEVMQMEKMFIQVDEVCEILGVSRSKAYQLMRQLNAELEKKGTSYNPWKGAS